MCMGMGMCVDGVIGLPSVCSAQSYDTTESRLKREFEDFGPVSKV